MRRHYDIAIVGSGFAGSLMAMVARRLGHSVILIERGSHPRVVIGESSTPLANLLLEELAIRYELPMLTPLTKWGTWQRSYPQLACGLKRGFSFFHHQRDQAAPLHDYQNRQLFVAASPHDEIADTHWFRADFDHFLVNQAIEFGIDYLDRASLTHCVRSEKLWQMTGTRDTHPFEASASFLIDATGPRGFLHRTLGLTESKFHCLPATAALYSHFSGVGSLQEARLWPAAGAPYPIDNAAVHHVFEGGWIWILHFNNGWTSAGVAATDSVAKRYHLVKGEEGWRNLLNSLPLVQRQFADARVLMPFKYAPRLSFLSSTITGEGWAMLPTAAGFVDPLLSTGIPLTLLGISRLASLLSENWESKSLAEALEDYARETYGDLEAAGNLIGSLYRHMANFDLFRSISMLYFAAATYTETARRLNKHHLAQGFLLRRHDVFVPDCQRILQRANQPLDNEDRSQLQRSILELVRAFDVAGLSQQPSDHCYPARASDLLLSAHKLEASPHEIETLLHASGFLVREIA